MRWVVFVLLAIGVATTLRAKALPDAELPAFQAAIGEAALTM